MHKLLNRKTQQSYVKYYTTKFTSFEMTNSSLNSLVMIVDCRTVSWRIANSWKIKKTRTSKRKLFYLMYREDLKITDLPQSYHRVLGNEQFY